MCFLLKDTELYWSLIVQDFNLQIQHEKGADNLIAEGFLRGKGFFLN